MKISRAPLALAVVAAGLFSGSAAFAAGDAVKGKAAFIKHGCWQCHAFVGQGSILSSGGKVIVHTELPLDAFKGFVRGTNRSMPPFSEKLVSDADLDDIYAYLESLPKPADPKSIKLLDLVH